MKLIPDSTSRMLAGQVLLARKHSPTILFGTGLVSMVGSTVLACRATLKLERTLDTIEGDKNRVLDAKEYVDSGKASADVTFDDQEVEEALRATSIKGMVKVAKLYAPAVGLGIFGVVCLTKSHRILEERNVALTAAYVAVDRAFTKYRERVVDRFGEDTDRELRYDFEDVDVIDEETGKIVAGYSVEDGDPGMYARWFDEESSSRWQKHPFEEYNWPFLRQQQNWANDMLKSRGYLFLNEVYGMLGMDHTSAGQIVGWVYDPHNLIRDAKTDVSDNYVDFRCWYQEHNPIQITNGRENAILLDFNVDGPVWQLIDDLKRAS